MLLNNLLKPNIFFGTGKCILPENFPGQDSQIKIELKVKRRENFFQNIF